MKRRLLLGAAVSGIVSLAGCIGSLHDVTEEGDDDDSDDTVDDTESDENGDEDDLNPTQQKIHEYRKNSDPIVAKLEVFNYSSSDPRRILSTPSTGEMKLTKQSYSGDVRVNTAYGALISSEDEYDDINNEVLDPDEEAFIEKADQESEAIINFQVPENQGSSIKLENVADIANKNRLFIEITHSIGVTDMTSLNNAFMIVDKEMVADGVIIGCGKARHQEEVNGHVIWELE